MAEIKVPKKHGETVKDIVSGSLYSMAISEVDWWMWVIMENNKIYWCQ